VKIKEIDNLLMGIEIPAGVSSIEFRFIPRLLLLGSVLSLLGISGITTYGIRTRKKSL